VAAPGFAESGVFLTVLEQKSFTKTAKRHGLSPARAHADIAGTVRLDKSRPGAYFLYSAPNELRNAGNRTCRDRRDVAESPVEGAEDFAG
jgi:hypothetical protein